MPDEIAFTAFINKPGKALPGQKTGFKTLFIDPGSPWQNAYVESFNSRLRDELLNVEIFSTLAEARVLGNEHRRYYNEKRPHSSLGGKSPRVYAAHCSVHRTMEVKTQNQISHDS